jgi:hypothetical protein
MTNRETMFDDPTFLEACRKSGAPVSPDQYRKWRRGRGLAFKVHTNAIDTTGTTAVQRLSNW